MEWGERPIKSLWSKTTFTPHFAFRVVFFFSFFLLFCSFAAAPLALIAWALERALLSRDYHSDLVDVLQVRAAAGCLRAFGHLLVAKCEQSSPSGTVNPWRRKKKWRGRGMSGPCKTKRLKEADDWA